MFFPLGPPEIFQSQKVGWDPQHLENLTIHYFPLGPQQVFKNHICLRNDLCPPNILGIAKLRIVLWDPRQSLAFEEFKYSPLAAL